MMEGGEGVHGAQCRGRSPSCGTQRPCWNVERQKAGMNCVNRCLLPGLYHGISQIEGLDLGYTAGFEAGREAGFSKWLDEGKANMTDAEPGACRPSRHCFWEARIQKGSLVSALLVRARPAPLVEGRRGPHGARQPGPHAGRPNSSAALATQTGPVP